MTYHALGDASDRVQQEHGLSPTSLKSRKLPSDSRPRKTCHAFYACPRSILPSFSLMGISVKSQTGVDHRRGPKWKVAWPMLQPIKSNRGSGTDDHANLPTSTRRSVRLRGIPVNAFTPVIRGVGCSTEYFEHTPASDTFIVFHFRYFPRNRELLRIG